MQRTVCSVSVSVACADTSTAASNVTCPGGPKGETATKRHRPHHPHPHPHPHHRCCRCCCRRCSPRSSCVTWCGTNSVPTLRRPPTAHNTQKHKISHATTHHNPPPTTYLFSFSIASMFSFQHFAFNVGFVDRWNQRPRVNFRGAAPRVRDRVGHAVVQLCLVRFVHVVQFFSPLSLFVDHDSGRQLKFPVDANLADQGRRFDTDGRYFVPGVWTAGGVCQHTGGTHLQFAVRFVHLFFQLMQPFVPGFGILFPQVFPSFVVQRTLAFGFLGQVVHEEISHLGGTHFGHRDGVGF